SRLQSPNHCQPPRCRACGPRLISLHRRLAAEWYRHIEIESRLQPPKTCRRHANNLERLAIQRKRLPDRIRAPAKFPLPKSIADHRALYAASLVVIALREQPAQLWLQLQHLKKIPVNPQPFALRASPPRPRVETLVPPRGILGKSCRCVFSSFLCPSS